MRKLRLEQYRLSVRRLSGRWRLLWLTAEVRRLTAQGSKESLQLARALQNSIGRPNTDELHWINRIESVRALIEASDRQIRWTASKPASLAMIAKRSSVPPKDGFVLLALVRAFGPGRGLEMGTSVGVSAAYQASGMHLNGSGELVTLEGHHDLVEQARELWRSLGLVNVTAVVGRFDNSLPRVLRANRLDYAFIDGNHHETATVQYFERIAARANPGALLVFDDITWSPGMLRAWKRIRRDPRIAAHATTGRFGVVVLST